jgi:hypothetical protein
MTDEQKKIQESMAQIEADNINLDYSKWSFERRRAGLPFTHELWQNARDQTLARMKAENAFLRGKYLAGLEAARAEKQRENDAEIDRELEPQKQRLMREWLVNHPNETADSFGKKAWIHLRQNLIEERNADAFHAEVERQKASGLFN